MREHLHRLREKVKDLGPTPTKIHGKTKSFIPRNISQIQFVFIGRDSHRNPLQRPYEGPYKVVEMDQKTVTVEMNNRKEVISIDRIKPAFIEPNTAVTLAKPKIIGRPKQKKK